MNIYFPGQVIYTDLTWEVYIPRAGKCVFPDRGNAFSLSGYIILGSPSYNLYELHTSYIPGLTPTYLSD